MTNIIIAVSKVDIPHELTKDKEYKIYYERYDIETKTEEILVFTDGNSREKWYKRGSFIIKK